MAVRFIIGRAGTGKTHRCLEAIRHRLRADPIEGPRLIFLVPEQAALQMERALLDPPHPPRARPARGRKSHRTISAAHRADVVSFRRLASIVVQQAGGDRQALTEPARVMVMRHLLHEHAGELRHYGRLADGGVAGRIAGFTEGLSRVIGELIEEAIDPRDLADAAAGQRAGGGRDTVGKLHDVAILYAAYVRYLGDNTLDPSQHLVLARELLDRCPWVSGADLWVDGFASLSGQETLTLIELARRCRHTEITLLADPACLARGRSPAAGQHPDTLFRQTMRTYEELHQALASDAFAIEEPVMLNPPVAPRFSRSPAIAAMERSVFAGAEGAVDPQTMPDLSAQAQFRHDPGPSNAPENQPADPSIELVELPSRRIEVEWVVSRVVRWVHRPDQSYRYRDVAIIARDLEPYHDLLAHALQARCIPHFIDRRRAASHHPVVELLRAATAVASEDWSMDAVRMALKTGLVPLAEEDRDELENYLIAHAINGSTVWLGPDWSFRHIGALDDGDVPSSTERGRLQRINLSRTRFVDLFRNWTRFAGDDAVHTGTEYASALADLLRTLSVPQTLAGWAGAAETDGDLSAADEHRQVWGEAMSLLDDFAFAFSASRLSIQEAAEALESGLSHLTLGLVPPTVDQVLVGSIDRSRHPHLKAVILLGFNDGVFPPPIREDSILDDDDRRSMQEAGLRVRPPRRDSMLDEPTLAYIALSRAAERAVITYAAGDDEGNSMRPSAFVSALRTAVPGLPTRRVVDPKRSRSTWDIATTRDLARRLAGEFRCRPDVERDDAHIRTIWNELYARARLDMIDDRIARRAMSGLADRNRASLDPKIVREWHGSPFRGSVSRLECYAACPFQYFARYGLQLQEREQAALSTIDVGTVHHAILESFIGRVAERHIPLGDLSAGEFTELLRSSCASVATRLPDVTELTRARDAYILRRSVPQIERVLLAHRRSSRMGSTRPVAVELPFGMDRPGSLPALELRTPAGNEVLLRGFIDRVDLAELSDELLGVVVDYKRARDKQLDLRRVYHGLSLQLIGYLLVLERHGQTLAGRPIRPVGAVYQSLSPAYELVDHPDQAQPSTDRWGKTLKPRGILSMDGFAALDNSTETGWLDTFAVFRKRNGEIGRLDQGDAVPGDSLRDVLEHTRMRLGQLADGILSGRIAVEPCRLKEYSPCTWCPMSSVCRFEAGSGQARFLGEWKRSEIFARMKRERRSAEPDSSAGIDEHGGERQS